MRKIGLVQSVVAPDKAANLAAAEAAFAAAAAEGAGLLVFPETYMAALPAEVPNAVRHEAAEPADGPFLRRFGELCRAHRMWAVVGFYERPDPPDPRRRVHNAVAVLDDEGRLVARHRKTHLYDAFGGRESDMFLPGEALFAPLATPFGRLGLFVCYELRFPEVARAAAVAGAELLVVPSAWYRGPLKEDHWDLLLRARALENTLPVFAADQAGEAFVGRSQAVDPLGVRLGGLAEEEGLLVVPHDPGRRARVRRALPALRHRRPDLYGALLQEGGDPEGV